MHEIHIYDRTKINIKTHYIIEKQNLERFKITPFTIFT